MGVLEKLSQIICHFCISVAGSMGRCPMVPEIREQERKMFFQFSGNANPVIRRSVQSMQDNQFWSGAVLAVM